MKKNNWKNKQRKKFRLLSHRRGKDQRVNSNSENYLFQIAPEKEKQKEKKNEDIQLLEVITERILIFSI
jgi:hypothetical protein